MPYTISATHPMPSPTTSTLGRPSDKDVLVPVNSNRSAMKTSEPTMDFGADYMVKQYGTDALLSGGAIAAGVFIFAPEPIVTKIIGGTLALSALAAGGVGKHYMYRNAYVHQALEGAVTKVQDQIETLGTEIQILEATSKSLESTNARLERTRELFTRQIASLSGQVGRLDSELSAAFKQLNEDRAAFEEEKAIKLGQLTDEIAEADARGSRAQEKLQSLDVREEALNALAHELQTRRLKLASSESDLRAMQAQLLDVLSDNPEAVSRLSTISSTPVPPLEPSHGTSSIESTRGSVLNDSATLGPDTQAVQNLKALASLGQHRGAKVRVDERGDFDLQRAGFFSQSLPRYFQEGASITSRAHFFRPVFKFFHDAKNQFDPSEVQQAFDGLCSMRQTYASHPQKERILKELIKVIAADNPLLEVPTQRPTPR